MSEGAGCGGSPAQLQGQGGIRLHPLLFSSRMRQNEGDASILWLHLRSWSSVSLTVMSVCRCPALQKETQNIIQAVVELETLRLLLLSEPNYGTHFSGAFKPLPKAADQMASTGFKNRPCCPT